MDKILLTLGLNKTFDEITFRYIEEIENMMNDIIEYSEEDQKQYIETIYMLMENSLDKLSDMLQRLKEVSEIGIVNGPINPFNQIGVN